MYVIYTQESCGYCIMAKKLLETKGQKYTEIPIDQDDDAKNYVKTFAKTVPQIFFGEKLIGGYHELDEYLALQD